MKTVLDEITLATHQPIEIIDISAQLRECCARSGIRTGLATLISRHTTAYVNLNEREPQLQLDMLAFLKRFIPRDGDYRHNVAPVDDRDNAHAHLLGLFMNASETIPVVDGKLMLGDWQSVFFIELDGPRPSRALTLQFLGEG
ncbi:MULTISPECIES: secondary thiamine-phosphate synthase enzyme YjbQ [Thiorhodovibrio]|uniref:secondary thiamine-phosphate synthase enzyme YjbQ n=1 Tax=Thiorhodovibrio TaxID=61593 RepID=UPI00191265A9|nr:MULTISPECIES: secondary thiamine-phosphate synthase enzyme YjbQ [Thiorhodovibrio]MBK5971083.1 secondary thiamine-phosphate synthase enzyme [Thiorhodovibrio winogradskyi]WPL10550.1 secondary thiamine-phosphate synthase enzyme [Thiorhodovibrio litoralis]